MEYINRLPLVGGFVELTKSKKGWALILALGFLVVAPSFGVDNEIVITGAATILTYIGGQSYVDSKKEAAELQDKAETIIDILQPDETELKIS